MAYACPDCQEPVIDSCIQCPHCGRPSFFPNVVAASKPEEKIALETRYQAAKLKLANRNCTAIGNTFEQAIQNETKVVVSMTFNELERLAKSDSAVFLTFYQRVQAGLHIPQGGKWDVLRGVVESAVFPNYKDNIRFGALSLDDTGVKNYGECSVILALKMVSHRTTLFEDNNVRFLAFDLQTKMSDADKLETGFRSIWEEREKLCLAKLGDKLQPGMNLDDFKPLLLVQGATTDDDRFVELHIWGSITIRSIEHVRVHRQRNRPLMTAIRDLDKKLKPYNLKIEL